MTTTPDARPVSEERLSELIRDCEEASRQAALFFPEPGRVHEHSTALLSALRELQSLRAEVEMLKARVYDQSTPEAVIRCRNAELLDERQRHLDTIASLEKDAARYQWLRTGDNDELVLRVRSSSGNRAFDPRVDSTWLPRGYLLDRAIDAAMEPATGSVKERI